VTRRTERLGEQIRGELARLLRQEVTDPRVGLVTLTRIDVAPDLSHAKVFWSALDAVPHGKIPRPTHADSDTAKGLASAAGFLRSQLARALATKRVPELRFVKDDSLEVGAETLRVLKEIERGKP
jgi:ribosome-binding factor A